MQVENRLEGKYAAPENHPPTCANPSPWLIHEARIELDGRTWIRGIESMWFRAESCWIGDLDYVKEFVEFKWPEAENAHD